MNITKKKMLPHEIELKLKAVYVSLKRAEKKAADFLVHDPEAFASMSITETAQKAGCSEATLCRFVKKLSYDNYPDFKDALQGMEDADYVDVFNSYSEQDSCIDIMKKTFQISINALQDTSLSIDNEEFEQAFLALKKATRIVCLGAGDAGTVAEALHNKLLRIGKVSFCPKDTDVMNTIATGFCKDDVAVCISHSGTTRNIIQAAKLYREKGVKVIAITNYPMSQLSKHADYVLFTASFTESINGEIISKRLAELCIIESLFVSLIMSDHKLSDAMKESNNSVLWNKIVKNN